MGAPTLWDSARVREQRQCVRAPAKPAELTTELKR
jgi:hypothetical protein